jgi:hypothetical protein
MGQHMFHFNCLFNFFKNTKYNKLRCPNCRQGDGSFVLQTRVETYFQKLYELENNGMTRNDSVYDWSEKGIVVTPKDYIKVLPLLNKKHPEVYCESSNEALVLRKQMAIFVNNYESILMGAYSVLEDIKKNKNNKKFAKVFLKAVTHMEGWQDEKGRKTEKSSNEQNQRSNEQQRTTGRFSDILNYLDNTTATAPQVVRHYNSDVGSMIFNGGFPLPPPIRFPQPRGWQLNGMGINNMVVQNEQDVEENDPDYVEEEDEDYSTEETEAESEIDFEDSERIFSTFDYVIIRNLSPEREPYPNNPMVRSETETLNLCLYATDTRETARQMVEGFQYVGDNEFALIMKYSSGFSIFRDAGSNDSEHELVFPATETPLETFLLSQENHSFAHVGGVHQVCEKIREILSFEI